MATTTDMAPTRRKAASAGSRAEAKTREHELEAQVAQLQKDLKSITDTLGKLTNAKVSEARDVASAEFKSLKAKGEEMISEAQDQASEAEQQLKDRIREKPLTSVATALGIGFVLALLTRH